MTKIRLQKVLQTAGIASRRGAEEMIEEGLVRVNGAIVTQMGLMVDPDNDAIKVNGKLLAPLMQKKKIYLAFYKPKGVLSAHEDAENRTTVWDLFPPRYRDKGLTQAGRLDYQSEGLMIVSNDGEFIEKCSHPRYGSEKVYWVKARGIPTEAQLDKLRRGIFIDNKRTRPCVIKRIPRRESKHTWCEVTLHEGRKNQLRKMFYAIGHGATKLKRVRIGPVKLGILQPGQCRSLTLTEIKRILKPT